MVYSIDDWFTTYSQEFHKVISLSLQSVCHGNIVANTRTYRQAKTLQSSVRHIGQAHCLASAVHKPVSQRQLQLQIIFIDFYVQIAIVLDHHTYGLMDHPDLSDELIDCRLI